MSYGYDEGLGQYVERYGEVDDDKPYMPRQLDWGQYKGQQSQYDQFLSDTKRELESTGGQGAAAMKSGLGQAQLAMQAQAVGRGANPGNERAALYAGSQMQRQGALQAAQMTQEEYAQLRGMEDEYRRQNVQNAISQQAMEMQRQQMMGNNYNAAVGADIQQTNSDWSNYSGLVGTVVNSVAGAAVASDVRAKQGIGATSGADTDGMIRDLARSPYEVGAFDDSDELGQMVRHYDTLPGAEQYTGGERPRGTPAVIRSIGAGGAGDEQDQLMRAADLYRYNYRPEYIDRASAISGIPPEIKQQRQTGVMAQDLASTPLGESMVYKDPQTGMLAIDGGQAVTTSLGLIGRLGERSDELEQRLAGLEAKRRAAGGRRA
ncbi:MAG: hypothetical protein WC700_10380 [Gemmatimonadaceae bacterium]|jgi:hypothetical protein